MEYEDFRIEAYEQSPGKWRALVRHSDWRQVHMGNTRFSLFASPFKMTAVDALDWARKAIDDGALQ